MLEYNVSPGAHAEDIDVRRLLKLTGFTIVLFAIGLAILYIQNPVLLFIYYGCITGAESPIDCVTGKPTHFRSSLFGMRYEGETEDLIDWHVLVLGAYEKPELFFLRDVSRGGVFLDIGANKGVYSLFMSKYAKEIHAFEPYDPVLQRFRHMIAINGIKNIFIHPVGLGEKAALLTFEQPKKNNEGMGSFAFVSTAGQHEQLQVVTGDEALEAAGVKEVELVKMDIEGFERPALIGLKKTLKRDRPIIVFELTARRDNSVLFKSEKDLRDHFPANYKFLQLEDRQAFTGAYSLAPLSVNFDSEFEQHDIVAFPIEKESQIPLHGPVRR